MGFGLGAEFFPKAQIQQTKTFLRQHHFAPALLSHAPDMPLRRRIPSKTASRCCASTLALALSASVCALAHAQSTPETTAPALEAATPETVAPEAATPPLSTLENPTPTLSDSEIVTPATTPTPDPATPESPSEGTSVDPAPGESEGVPSLPAPNENAPVTQSSATQLSQLQADKLSVSNGVVTATANAGNLVKFQSGTSRITAQQVQIDSNKRTVTVPGEVLVERDSVVRRGLLNATAERKRRFETTSVTETLSGRDFFYDFNARAGRLDAVRLVSSGLNVNAQHLTLGEQRSEARDVVVRPGGLSLEEERIYGRPPFSIRARSAILLRSPDASDDASPGATPNAGRVSVQNAGFYVGRTRLFPIPGAILRRNISGRESGAFTLTPRVSVSDADRVLITTQLAFPLNRENPGALDLVTDLGFSQRVGFRGGARLESRSKFGRVALGALFNDVVTTQLTSRIQLDRLPELTYRSPTLGLLDLPGGRRAGLIVSGSIGHFRETETGDEDRRVDTSRQQAGVTLTTRVNDRNGPYLEVFARSAKYGGGRGSYGSSGLELGYIGKLLPRIVGQISYRANDLNGQTPFRFDRVEIRRELRTTFDVGVTPRYILPFDLRYDVSQKRLRDYRLGVLRSYKTFAYGVVYQSSRQTVQLELRQAF